jgi:hypothetical protein
MGGDVSRSAVGRYTKSAEERLREYREKQQVAEIWNAQLKGNPNGDVGQMLLEAVKMLASRTIEHASDEEEPTDPLYLSRLARTLRDLASADKVKLELAKEIRGKVLAEVAEQAVTVATEAGLSADRAAQIRRDVLGLRPQPAAGGAA